MSRLWLSQKSLLLEVVPVNVSKAVAHLQAVNSYNVSVLRRPTGLQLLEELFAFPPIGCCHRKVPLLLPLGLRAVRDSPTLVFQLKDPRQHQTPNDPLNTTPAPGGSSAHSQAGKRIYMQVLRRQRILESAELWEAMSRAAAWWSLAWHVPKPSRCLKRSRVGSWLVMWGFASPSLCISCTLCRSLGGENIHLFMLFMCPGQGTELGRERSPRRG